jgi:hypothetical protein
MYVGTRQSGPRGLARAHGRSRSLRGFGLSRSRANRALSRRLGQLEYGIDVSSDMPGGGVGPIANPYAAYANPNYTAYPGVPVSGGLTPGGLTPAEAAVLTSGINTAGVLGKQALTPVPSVTYNPTTGLYSATGGAALPAGLGLSGLTSSLTSFLPWLLLGGGLLLVVSLVKK